MQTFYLAQSGPNLVFHADNAQRVYIQSRSLFLTGDGTIVSSASMGAGTVYTVVSDDTTATPEQLRHSTVPRPAGPAASSRRPDRRRRALPPTPPSPTRRVAALAQHDHRRHRLPRGSRPPHLRQGGSHRVVDGRPHPVHHRHPSAGPGGRRRRPASCSGPGGATANRSRPPPWSCCGPSASRPGRRWATSRHLQSDHRPLRRGGQGRPRLGAGVVPRLRLAELRPDGRRPPGQPLARARCWPAPPVTTLAHLPWIPIGVVAGRGGRGRRGRRRRRRRVRPPGPTRWPPTSSGAGPRLGPAPAYRRDPVGLRRAAGRRGDAAVGPGSSAPPTLVERYTYGGRRALRRARSPPPWPSPAAPPGRAGPAPAGSSPPQDRDTASASSNEAPAASSGR